MDITHKARLHQFDGKVALKLGDNETVYMQWNFAENLAKELKLASKQVRNFHHYETTEVTYETN